MSLSLKQLKQLGIAASAAVAHQRSLGALEVPPDMRTASKSAQNEFWRHQQVALCTQRVCSFKDMVNEEYRPMMQHLEALAGPAFQRRATESTVRVVEDAACHRVPGCEYMRDMYHWLTKAGYKDGYAIAIMKGKFRGITDLRLLREHELKMLHDTVVNRCRKKLGIGSDDDRNKQERGVQPQRAQRGTEARTSAPVSAPPVASNGSPPVPSKERSYTLKTRTARGSEVPASRQPF
jgi:hypothetical protein